MNTNKKMFQEAFKVYQNKYAKDETEAFSKSILCGLYFQNSEQAGVVVSFVESLGLNSMFTVVKGCVVHFVTKQFCLCSINLLVKSLVIKDIQGKNHLSKTIPKLSWWTLIVKTFNTNLSRWNSPRQSQNSPAELSLQTFNTNLSRWILSKTIPKLSSWTLIVKTFNTNLSRWNSPRQFQNSHGELSLWRLSTLISQDETLQDNSKTLMVNSHCEDFQH